MQPQQFFKKFNYSIVPTALLDKTSAPDVTNANGASLVNVNIDFEQEDFNLEGDWQYMMSSNKHAEKNWFHFHQQRVSIKANIYPGLAIDLSDDNNDGQVFIIEGTIKDNDNTGECSGLLVLDKIIMSDKADTSKWNMSFYLYDTAHEDCEISFRFPVYGKTTNQLLN